MDDFYNLFEESWISVINKDLSYGNYGIKDLLLNAHEILELAEDNPLTKYGIYRILVALVMDALELKDIDSLNESLEEKQFSQQSIDNYCKTQKAKFYLFSESNPFFQNPNLKNTEEKDKKSIASLFQFIPSGNNTILFNQILEKEYKVSPEYCAKALCTLSAFIPVGGRGYTASINGRPPWYILLKGRNLFETLLLNSCVTSIELNSYNAPVLWNIPDIVQTKPIMHTSTLQGLTWLPRYIYLFPEEGGKCTYSGRHSEILVSNIAFEQGWSFKGEWIDPHVSYIISKKGRFPLPVVRGKKVWRDIGPLLLQKDPYSSTKFENPIIIQQFKALKYEDILSDDYLMLIEAYGIRTDQAKYLEWFEESLSLPIKILRDSKLIGQIQPTIDMANSVESLMNKAINIFSTQNRRKLNTKSLKAEALQNYWGILEHKFKEEFLFALYNQDGDDINARGQLELEWKHILRNIGRIILEKFLGGMSTNPKFLQKQIETMDFFNKSIYSMLFKKSDELKSKKKMIKYEK